MRALISLGEALFGVARIGETRTPGPVDGGHRDVVVLVAIDLGAVLDPRLSRQRRFDAI
jgi:hypothetical protein